MKKRKLSSLFAGDGDETLFEDSSDKGSEKVQPDAFIRRHHTNVEAKGKAIRLWSTGAYDSNMFKLKTTELLAKVRPDYERCMVKLEHSLRRLKDIIERIPDREAKPVCSMTLISI